MLHVASFSLIIKLIILLTEFKGRSAKLRREEPSIFSPSAIQSAVEGTAFSVSDYAQCRFLVYREEFKAQMVI